MSLPSISNVTYCQVRGKHLAYVDIGNDIFEISGKGDTRQQALEDLRIQLTDALAHVIAEQSYVNQGDDK